MRHAFTATTAVSSSDALCLELHTLSRADDPLLAEFATMELKAASEQRDRLSRLATILKAREVPHV